MLYEEILELCPYFSSLTHVNQLNKLNEPNKLNEHNQESPDRLLYAAASICTTDDAPEPPMF
jgi:hypothetical protein